MVKLQEHREKIADVERQIGESKSWKRRNDLRKYREKLLRQLAEAEKFLDGRNV